MKVDIYYCNVTDDETDHNMLPGDDLVAKIRVPADIVAQVATGRKQNAVLNRPTTPYNLIANICFVLEYPAGRKEGGCTS